jgi:pimeloyl-ACP methyl ester carboxylesterase
MKQVNAFPSGTYAGLVADDLGGADERPPLVLLHGLTFDRQMWRPALAELETIDPGRRAIALDLPGHGDSPDATSYTVEALVERVHAAIGEAHLEAPVLVGHSAAASTAFLYGVMHPSRGVVAVEGTLRVGAFAGMARSLEPMLRGRGFDDAWSRITANVFRLDEVAPRVRDFVLAMSRPRQDVVLGYWQDLFERTPQELDALVKFPGEDETGRHATRIASRRAATLASAGTLPNPRSVKGVPSKRSPGVCQSSSPWRRW